MPKHRLNTLDYPPAARPGAAPRHAAPASASVTPYSPLSAPWTPEPARPVYRSARRMKWHSVASVIVRAVSMGR